MKTIGSTLSVEVTVSDAPSSAHNLGQAVDPVSFCSVRCGTSDVFKRSTMQDRGRQATRDCYWPMAGIVYWGGTIQGHNDFTIINNVDISDYDS
ncbi:hypothetical protein PoB_006126900 [Plakobranchus ocellatus]|uniref:Uncharacterized protein n=1 Tax=Plakobranchus ocellatus TaxID=259542 RepID=A0AAV4CSD3_9GAST|nr:hypothetical protein PoB_006126900 [Plakobranchus ocellatus]